MDGTIYFQRGAYIYGAKADGSGVFQVSHTGTTTHPDHGPSISPDGKIVTYAWSGKYIYMVAASGGQSRLLAQQLDVNDPVWSRDGSKIAFSYEDFVYFPSNGLNEAISGLWEADATTGKVINHYDSTVEQRFQPQWSPDGTALIAAADLGNAPERYSAPDHYGIVSVSLTTHHSTNLSNDLDHDYFDPAISPDGQSIASVRYPHAKDHKVGGVLWVMNADGSSGRQVTGSVDMGHLAWSPDGNAIAFDRDGSIYETPVSGGAAVEVLPNAQDPSWAGTGQSSSRPST
ncbi:MAG: TolB family protein, partial [Chloroflexota bacterium]